jgi:hypothetical protein
METVETVETLMWIGILVSILILLISLIVVGLYLYAIGDLFADMSDKEFDEFILYYHEQHKYDGIVIS